MIYTHVLGTAGSWSEKSGRWIAGRFAPGDEREDGGQRTDRSQRRRRRRRLEVREVREREARSAPVLTSSLVFRLFRLLAGFRLWSFVFRLPGLLTDH